MKAKSEAMPTFEEGLATLEQLVHDLEDGQLGLEAALAHYEQGIKLVRHCHGLISQAEKRIMIVSGVDEAGQPLTKPFAAE